MKTIFLVAFVFAGFASADQISDRAAIEKTLHSVDASVLTSDFDGRDELVQLAEPQVVISKQPWGEATIVLPGGLATNVLVMTAKKIRFMTPEVAIVDAVAKEPVFIVMKKEGADWKIASLRIVKSLPLVTAR